MVGFRNIPVHGYDTVDLSIVRDVVERHLDDLLNSVTSSVIDRVRNGSTTLMSTTCSLTTLTLIAAVLALSVPA